MCCAVAPLEWRLLGKKVSLPLVENDRREKEIFQEHLNQFKTSKTMLPRRKREPREEILKQNQWSHCLRKIKDVFSWEGVNYLFTWWDIENTHTLSHTHTINKYNIRKSTGHVLFKILIIFPNASNLTTSGLKKVAVLF